MPGLMLACFLVRRAVERKLDERHKTDFYSLFVALNAKLFDYG